MAGDGIETQHRDEGDPKRWVKSVTIAAAAGAAAIQIAEQFGAVPPGTASKGANLLQTLLEFLAVFGIRRAIGFKKEW